MPQIMHPILDCWPGPHGSEKSLEGANSKKRSGTTCEQGPPPGSVLTEDVFSNLGTTPTASRESSVQFKRLFLVFLASHRYS